MKKVISVFLAALMLLGAFSVIALADEGEGFIPVYTVRVAPHSADMVNIVNVEDPNSNTVNAGRPFYFTVEYKKGYAPDSTVVVKAYPASYPAELVGTDKDVSSVTLTPDEHGVYCISQVNEDYYVEVLNVTETQFSSLKEMLLNFFNAIINLFKKLFNR
jgi:hypothetical protein